MDLQATVDYVRLEEAARVANVSEKTVRNWADTKKIGRRKVKGVVYYNVADLKVQGAKNAETKLVRDNPYAGAVLPQLAEAVAGAMAPRMVNAPAESEPAPSVPLERKLWLSIEEAVAYTGLGAFYIRAQAQGRRIGPNGAIVYRREDLDQIR